MFWQMMFWQQQGPGELVGAQPSTCSGWDGKFTVLVGQQDGTASS